MTLNPCPFCGGTPAIETRPVCGGARVLCPDCRTRTCVMNSAEAAAAAWNTRADQPSSLRDDIAREVLRAALPRLMTASLRPEALDATVRFSYAMADAMMKARS